MNKHTPGPWRWEFNKAHRSITLVGGRPQFDLTVMDFARWGMSGATMRLLGSEPDGLQLLFRVHERPDWYRPEVGREHHEHWHQLLTHPDARLIEAAPDLLEALEALVSQRNSTEMARAGDLARAAIRKARGEK